ncbi:unnamed protein product [Peronospora belbahrii]|uniref:Uncharacterized protein n=1 Tax=Peronospora belbahrii TaxID=622444 RepID=A0ABN8CJE2_9STRA|nr:unnamed protein product [Peronospora belbahrii]
MIACKSISIHFFVKSKRKVAFFEKVLTIHLVSSKRSDCTKRYVAAYLPLRGFGYDPGTQNFPNKILLPKRQVKPGKEGATLLISTDQEMEIRKKNDSYGRSSTYFRRALTEPVIADDGTELNMDEVQAARKRLLVKTDEINE